MGIASEEGRDENLMKYSEVALPNNNGTSIFDPVLCEVSYSWFCPDGGLVLDPFAGGSVRGIVAAKLGRHYHGVDLRLEQVEANRKQAAMALEGTGLMPQWQHGNSLEMGKFWKGKTFDMILSCPPYHDLEQYSDDPNDLSNMPYDSFLETYRAIIRESVNRLKSDRFAVWVVGEIRDKKGGGAYKSFIPETIRAFEDAGANYYNEGILINSVGSWAMRVGRIFNASRKFGKVHQNVLVFVKGDPFVAAKGLAEFADRESESNDGEINVQQAY